MLIGPRTQLQARFIRAYLGDACYNASKAARMAGYSTSSAHAIGSQLLKKPHIQAAIELTLIMELRDVSRRGFGTHWQEPTIQELIDRYKATRHVCNKCHT